MRFGVALLLVLIVLPGCQRASQAPGTHVAGATRGLQPWLLPSSPGAAQPDLLVTPDGRVLLSWIDRVPGRRNALQFSAWDSGGRWQSAPRTIAVGDSLVVNESDPPQLAATRDGALWVHWSQKVGADVALQLSRSVDGGFNWSAPLQVASATPPVELGFATLWPQSRDSVGMVWLDGNAAVVARAAPAQAIAATTLRTAVFSANLQPGAVTAIDTRVCDCCHPAVAVTTRKPLLVYRDRTADEIRDIVATQFDGVHWSAPRPVHVDGWKMSGCPVNGPAVAANADEVVVAWYTSAGGEPSVQLARSSDAGDTFAPPVAIDHGNAVLGRVAVALDARQAWVLWLREDARAQSLWLARYTTDLSRQLGRIQVAALQGRGRITGFPQMVVQSGTAYVAWTDIDGGSTLLHGATITP